MTHSISASHAASQSKHLFDLNLMLTISQRLLLLRALAAELAIQKDALVLIADVETHLGEVRLMGEVGRTCFQLNALADYIEQEKHLRSLSQTAISGAPPLGRPQLDITMVPVGPVAVFAASNFPFAFSVLGGDTAAALAAGCPVIVKAHPAHPKLSRAVLELAHKVLAQLDMSTDWILMVDALGIEQGQQLVMQPDVAAVSFTGSLQAGKALAQLISQRAQPIPFFGELGSVNPVLVMPGYLERQSAESAHALADSIVQGAGQFCTSPGLVFVDDSTAGDAFVRALAQRLDGHQPHQMLTTGMQTNFDKLKGQSAALQGVCRLTSLVSPHASGDGGPVPTLLETSLAVFLAEHTLQEEIFGPYALAVRVPSDSNSYQAVLSALQGSLTLTFWADASDVLLVKQLLPYAMQRAGRVLFGGVPTGVAVAEAQHHGGPWPASTRPDSTSVGMRSVERFLRPVVLQDKPLWLD